MLLKQNKKVSPIEISNLLDSYHPDLLKGFYEMQSEFLTVRYKFHKSLESSNIVICFIRDVHLAILRMRERNFDHDVSLNNFLTNLNSVKLPAQKIISIVNTTGIPKETVRRKIKLLIEKEVIYKSKISKEYYWNLNAKREEAFLKIMNHDINRISKFIYSILKFLNLEINIKAIENEIRAQFSFYFYHFLNCQLSWLKMWQTKIKDTDLIFIAMQALIPTLKYTNKDFTKKNIGLENFNTIIGQVDKKNELSASSVSASSVSEVSGIPRATCMRKLEKLVKLGLLVREIKTKRYFVNQHTISRTKYITKKENIIFTVRSFSEFLSIVISALLRNKK